MPVYYRWLTHGKGVAVDYGRSGPKYSPTYNSVAVSGDAALGPVILGAGVSRYFPDSGATMTGYGGTLNVLGFFQTGVGYSSTPGEKRLHVPLGLGAPLLGCVSQEGAFFGWISPRLDIVRISTPVETGTKTRFGFSGGIHVETKSGLGLQVAADAVRESGYYSTIYAVGIHYARPGLVADLKPGEEHCSP